jgi:hypothetical protein
MAIRARISSSDHYGPQRGKTDGLESPLGHKRPICRVRAMSASPPNATELWHFGIHCFEPKAEVAALPKDHRASVIDPTQR